LWQVHGGRFKTRSRSGKHSGEALSMIIPCIDLMEGKVVQLVQGREKVFEAKSLDDTLAAFASFQQIQVIDLDAAMGTGSNDGMVGHLTNRATVRAGGGVRTVERAQQLVVQGAFR